jgi:hypothetical protein
MAEKKGPELSLSGYQPGAQESGLGMMADRIYEAFMQALRDNDQTGETLRFPVVGVVEGRVGHIGRPGSDKTPSIELRFISIEPVLDRDVLPKMVEAKPDDDAGLPPTKVVLELMHGLRDVRLGEQPALDLDVPALTVVPESGGESTSGKPAKRSRRRGPGVTAGDTSAD